MTCHCTLNIKLCIQAPFLCSATGLPRWGIDAAFHRDYLKRPVIMKSHIKGKLREAWQELENALKNTEDVPAFQADADHWLGRETGTQEHESAEPFRGRMLFSDFVCTEESISQMQRFHRIRMNRITGTAEEGALICMETPFESGAETQWKGEIIWSSENREQGEKVRDQVLAGLRWITAMGAEKTAGFGRLLKVICEDFSVSEFKTFQAPADKTRISALSITLSEAVAVGGVKIKDNYMESGSIFSGAIIKGSLARCIRHRLNLPRNAPIADCEAMENAGLGLLGRWFEKITFRHAFPCVKKDRRPVCPPFSLLKAGGEIYDAALSEDWELFADGKGKKVAPAFAPDWKSDRDVKETYGWAVPKILAVTRTAIDSGSRRAAEEKLYTFEYICPEDENSRQIFWNSEICLPEDCPETEHDALAAQLEYVLRHWFSHIGKRQGRIHAETLTCQSSVSSGEPLREGLSIICLRADAMMTDPAEIRQGSHAELLAAYGKYWEEISGRAFRLIRFYARQKLAGGYLGMRFPTQGKYFPFLLTQAGSVFVLHAKNPESAEKQCRDWLRKGLPEAGWVKKLYGKQDGTGADWKKCPFIRENGFGEIAVNLPCHWEKRRKS